MASNSPDGSRDKESFPALRDADNDTVPTTSVESSDVKKRYIHSDIYDRLVDDDDDLIGLVAYGLYQSEKRRWIKNFETKNGRTPSEDEVKAFCFIYDNEMLNKLMSESDDLIFRVTEERIKERIAEVAARAFNERAIKEISDLNTKFATETAKIAHLVGKLSGYKHHVIGHILGFLVLAGASAIVLLIVKFGEPSIYFILWKLGLVSGS
jgi:hypothetical protein